MLIPIFFTLGNKSHKKAIASSGKFKKIISVGSLFMENIFYKKKLEKKLILIYLMLSLMVQILVMDSKIIIKIGSNI